MTATGAPASRTKPRLAVWILSFGSAATLLGFLYGIAPMHVLGVFVLLPSLLGIAAVWAWSFRSGDTELHTLMTIGFWGGLWGTLGYDLIRVPLHYLGFNPFPPIRSYGMFIIGAQHATLVSDAAGVLYHFSNGITFAWIYALLMSRRSFAWAVLWGLILESIAVFTPFGAIYGIRSAYAALGLAYFAHLFYGIPLGWACEDPSRTMKALGGPRLRVASVTALAAIAVFLSTAWEKPWRSPDLAAGEIQVGPDAIHSGWTRVSVDDRLSIINAGDDVVDIELRGIAPRLSLSPSDRWVAPPMPPGLFQLVVYDRPWRSAFVSVERGGYPFPDR